MANATTFRAADYAKPHFAGYREMIVTPGSEEAAKALVHISEGDSKKGDIPSLGFMPGHGLRTIKSTGEIMVNVPGTCPASCVGVCDNACYAIRDCRYVFTARRYALNTLIFRNYHMAIISAVVEYCRKNKPKYFRLLQAGELENVKMLWCFGQMALNCPETVFFLYTKRPEIIEQLREKQPALLNLANLVITISQWHNTVNVPDGFATFEYDDGADPEVAALPHCPAVDENGRKTGTKCENCLWCARHKPGERRAVYAH